MEYAAARKVERVLFELAETIEREANDYSLHDVEGLSERSSKRVRDRVEKLSNEADQVRALAQKVLREAIT